MKLFPAIDLRGGNVVRLTKGDFAAETVYGDDPVAVARSFVAAGAGWVHVVDLDAAKTGSATNLEAIAAIVAAVEVPVQAGGGVRDHRRAERLLDLGVRRVVVGTAAVEAPGFVRELAAAHPSQVAVGLDGRGGKVAVHGWIGETDLSVIDVARRFEDAGVAAVIVTDIDRDGMLGGPDIVGLGEVLAATSLDVVASGGVGAIDDLRALAAVRAPDGRRLAGAIVGKAIYEGRFDVASAVAACGEPSQQDGRAAS